ncbi:MAG TPA: serine hydrolase domain-containing protein [Steroidobacteraceae bacterium]|nr:serine hydrolase domain-containing protein [Steroidobacteraceae bacterium]
MHHSMSGGLRERGRGRAVAAILTAALLLLAGGASAQESPGAPAAATTAAPALTTTDLTAFLDGFVPYAIHSSDIAGATISVVANGQIIFAKGYGYADMRTRKPVLADRTLFRPGSVSKLFSWTAVMQLVEAGKLDLDRDVNDYLDFKIPEKFGRPITLRNVMTHTAGFEDTNDGILVPSPTDFVPYREYLVKHLPPRLFPAGKVTAYSNYGAMLAGYIVQRVSGEPYDDYIARHILRPLGMTRSTFDQPLPPALANDLSHGYTTASDPKPVPFEDIESAPAGALSTTAVDMAHFMIAQLEGGSYKGASIMSPATTQLMHTPVLRMAPGMNGPALGFMQEDRNGLRIIGHPGILQDFHSDLQLVLDKDVGFFISLNSSGKDAAAESVKVAVFRAFLDRYYPYSPPAEATLSHPQGDAARVAGWYEFSFRNEAVFRILDGLGQARVSALPSGEIETSVLKDYAGVPKRWREVGPLAYREVGGQAHLKFVTDSDSQIAYWVTDDVIPAVIFQRVHGLAQKGEFAWMGEVCLAVFVLTMAIWIGGAIVRRRFKTPLLVTLREKRLRLASRIGILLMLAMVCAWVGSFASISSRGSINGMLTIAYVLGLLALLGALAVLAEAVRRALRGPGGWLVRSAEALLGLCAIYGIWAILFFRFADFSYRW